MTLQVVQRSTLGVLTSVDVGPNWAITRFKDGTEVHAHPVYDPASLALAAELGYGDGEEAVDAMTRHHDYLHSALAVAQGLTCSPTLWAVAHEEPMPDGTAAEEETVLRVQAVLNGVTRSEETQ